VVKNDFDSFSQMLDSAYEAVGKQAMGSAGKAIVFRSLSDVSMEDFGAALTAHLSDPSCGMFAPTAAHIRSQLAKFAEADGRPGADEAWAIALSGQDEGRTIITNDDIAAAFTAIRPILDAGDEVGARMAFLQAYRRVVAEARAAKTALRWWPSLGCDKKSREPVLLEAYRTGKLPRAQVAGWIADIRAGDLKALPPTVSKEAALNRDQVRQKLRELVELLSMERAAKADDFAQWENDRKALLAAQAAEKVDQLLGAA